MIGVSVSIDCRYNFSMMMIKEKGFKVRSQIYHAFFRDKPI